MFSSLSLRVIAVNCFMCVYCTWLIHYYSVPIGQHGFPVPSPFTQPGCCCCCCCYHAALRAYSCFWPLIAFVENTVVAADIWKGAMKWLKITQDAAHSPSNTTQLKSCSHLSFLHEGKCKPGKYGFILIALLTFLHCMRASLPQIYSHSESITN